MIHETMQFMELADAGHEFRQRRRAAALAYRKKKGECAKMKDLIMGFFDQKKTYISIAMTGIVLIASVVKDYFPAFHISDNLLKLMAIGGGMVIFWLMNRDNKKTINLIRNGNG